MTPTKKTAPVTAPIYKKLLIAAIVLYVISSSVMLTQIWNRIGEVEHEMEHLGGPAHR